MTSNSERMNDLAERLAAQAKDLKLDNFASFIYTYEVINQYLDACLRKEGLNRTQMSILHILIARGGVLTPTELSRRVTRSKNAITQAVDRLEKLGLVKSSGSREDRRVRRVSITGRGLDIVEKTMAVRHRIGSQVMQCLDDEEAGVLRHILGELRSHAQHLKDDTPPLT